MNKVIKREEVIKTVGNVGKVGGEAATVWMHIICNLAQMQGKVTGDCIQATVVDSVGKADKTECASYRGISLLNMSGKTYGKIVFERLQDIIKDEFSEEQDRFKMRRFRSDL